MSSSQRPLATTQPEHELPDVPPDTERDRAILVKLSKLAEISDRVGDVYQIVDQVRVVVEQLSTQIGSMKLSLADLSGAMRGFSELEERVVSLEENSGKHRQDAE